MNREKPDYMRILAACINCKREFILHVSKAGLEKYRDGELIQDALPELTRAERELLISHHCEKCFDKLFNDS